MDLRNRPEQALNHIPTLSFLASQAIAVQRAVENDFVFLQDIHTQPKCPDYNGFNTRLCREAGMLPQHKTDVSFLPLIDRPPTHHDTTKTTIDKGLTLMRAVGDDVLIFTADQQLYKIAINIVFSTHLVPICNSSVWWNAYAHEFYSCHSCHYDLQCNERNSILTIWKCRENVEGQNFRAIRMLVEEMLQCILEGVNSFSHLIIVLDVRASHSRTTKLWSDNLVKTVHHNDDLLACRTWRRLGSSPLCCRSHAALFPCSWLPRLCTLCCTLCSSDERPQTRDDEEITACCICSSHPRHL